MCRLTIVYIVPISTPTYTNVENTYIDGIIENDAMIYIDDEENKTNSEDFLFCFVK